MDNSFYQLCSGVRFRVSGFSNSKRPAVSQELIKYTFFIGVDLQLQPNQCSGRGIRYLLTPDT